MGQKILLVDDDKDLCDLYETTLKAEGFDIKIAKMIDKAKEFGVVDYVVKSEVDMSTVINRIKEAMAK